MARFQKYLDKFDNSFIQKKLNEGLTIRKISVLVDIPEKRLCEMVKHFNLNITNKGVTYNVNHTYFDNIDTEQKAYILGFIVADGSIEVAKRKNKYSKRVTFCQSIQDKEIVEKIRDIICPDIPIKWYNASTKTIKRMDQTNFRFTSEQIVDNLIEKYGVVPNKTFNINFYIKNIPERLFRHFIRGFMDGDGHIAKNSVEFIFTSLPFMEQFIAFFEPKGFSYRVKKEKGKTIDYYRLYINTNRSNISLMYSLLYNDSTLYLNRKKSKIKQHLNSIS